MEQDMLERPSRIPSHLRPFTRPSITTEPVLTEDNALALDISPPRSVELCPPHWRLKPKRSFGSVVKSLLLKEWPLPPPRTPPRSVSDHRPGMMRMKDSDDYITARAANPRTGLISPSVGTLTPRLQDTPQSPAEALKIKTKDLQISPSPDVKERPTLKRANEGRKISAGSKKLWKADEHGWLTEVGTATASPRLTDAAAAGDLVYCQLQDHGDDDALIVHMPSAREPQPYAYPGCSAKQIEAAEFYKRKARRVSNEGYDKRILQGSQQSSAGSKPDYAGVRKVSSSKACCKPGYSKISHPSEESPAFHGGYITVAKRRIGPHEFHDTNDCHAGAEPHVTDFAPFTSPKTPVPRGRDADNTELHTSRAPRYHEGFNTHQIRRKPVDSGHDSPQHLDDLKDLPRVALVHPRLAALPQSHPHRLQQQHVEPRKCSFGCVKDLGSDVCIERRVPSGSTISSTSHSLFEQSTRDTIDSRSSDSQRVFAGEDQLPPLMEHLATAIIGIIDGCRNSIAPVLPRLQIVDALRADQTRQNKLQAMRQILSMAGQAVVLLAVVATLWHVGNTLVHVLEVVLWPVLIPFKVLSWLGSGRN